MIIINVCEVHDGVEGWLGRAVPSWWSCDRQHAISHRSIERNERECNITTTKIHNVKFYHRHADKKTNIEKKRLPRFYRMKQHYERVEKKQQKQESIIVAWTTWIVQSPRTLSANDGIMLCIVMHIWHNDCLIEKIEKTKWTVLSATGHHISYSVMYWCGLFSAYRCKLKRKQKKQKLCVWKKEEGREQKRTVKNSR